MQKAVKLTNTGAIGLPELATFTNWETRRRQNMLFWKCFSQGRGYYACRIMNLLHFCSVNVLTQILNDPEIHAHYLTSDIAIFRRLQSIKKKKLWKPTVWNTRHIVAEEQARFPSLSVQPQGSRLSLKARLLLCGYRCLLSRLLTPKSKPRVVVLYIQNSATHTMLWDFFP